jgi:type VI secretion system protein ImpJ
MQALSRVVWSEGMHLAQHHFQAQTAYFERLAATALADLFASPYGLLACELDEAALLNGVVGVRAAHGIMPDGLVFSFPEEPSPQPVDITATFSPTQSSHQVLLAIPPEVAGRANCDTGVAGAGGDVRYSMAEQSFADETTGSDVRPVQLARKNFRLLLDNEPGDGLVTLPLGRIRRDGAGRFVYDAAWVGPCLRVGANRRLRELVGRMVDMLEERAAATIAERTAAAGHAEYAPREVVGFWFLHALNSAIPTLRHWRHTGSAHPEQLYLLLAQLAGALCTFSLRSDPRKLPPYDHDEPESCFDELERHIRSHLDVILPMDAIRLDVQRTEPTMYTVRVPDTRCFEPAAHWYLGLRSSAPAGDVIARAPRLVKLCSAKFIARLIREAYPGLGIEHVPTPPPELAPRLGVQYFRLQRTEPCWKSVVDTGEVGLYVPAALPDAEIELKVVLERRS